MSGFDPKRTFAHSLNFGRLMTLIARRTPAIAARFVIGPLLVASCAGMIWEDSGWPGPLVEGNRHPNTVYSCDHVSLAIADTKYCEHAFVDHRGRKLQLPEDVVGVIDAYLPNVASLSSWAGPNKYALRYQQGGGLPPYRLYILTISPIIVMAVPTDNEQRRRAFSGCGDEIKDGCLSRNKLDIPYRFRERPEVRAGSFWFSPDMKMGEQAIAEAAQNVVIPLGSSSLELTSDGKNWEVHRNSR